MFSPNRREFISGAAACAAYAALGRGVDGTRVGMRRGGHPLCEVGEFAPTAKDYVQDGLVAMWDGIENAGWGTHDSSATIWKDLKGNNDLSLMGSGWIWNDVSAYFSVNSYAVATSNINIFPFTIQVVFKGKTTGDNYVFGNNGSSAGWVIQNNFFAAKIGTSYRILNYSSETSTENTYSISASYETSSAKAYSSGVEVSSLSYSGNLISGLYKPTVFGFVGSNSSSSSGTAYCIRIYDRSIPSSYVAKNYAIDRARFNLP